MRTVLVSQDIKLRHLCRETLSEVHGDRCELVLSDGTEPVPSADLHIWDFHPGLNLPEWISNDEPRNHIFLVSGKDLNSFSETHAGGGIIALKPVGRAMLRTFVDQAAKPTIQHQISQLRADRDALLQYLMQANLKLQEYDQERTNFLGRALHDFRAPLTALTGYCGLLENEQLGPITEDQREVLVRMQNSAKRLSRLTSGMFQLSIGQHVEQKPRLLHGEISECVLQALHEVGPFIEERHLDVSVSVSPSPEGLLFDPLQLEQVVLNLLDNACKFTPKFGKIEVRGKPYFWDRRMSTTGPIPIDRRELRQHAPNSFRIDVLDSGPPIPDDHLIRIFEEYTRYSGGQDRSGGGLGLAICSMTVRLHNGCVWAENSPSGPMFSFVLPFPQNSVGPERYSQKTSAATAGGPAAVEKR